MLKQKKTDQWVIFVSPAFVFDFIGVDPQPKVEKLILFMFSPLFCAKESLI